MANFSLPEHVFTGDGAVEEAMPMIAQLGKRCLIVTGPNVGKSPMVRELTNSLSAAEIQYEIYDRITGEPDDRMVEEGVRIYREFEAEFVIGIGGGSPIDSAKAVALKSGEEAIPPIVAIPTTSGTGSEATRFTVITDSKADIKMLIADDRILPQIAILNEQYCMDMPRRVTAMTGLDALTHAVEAYTSKKASELTDVYAKSAVSRIMKYLPRAYENGYDEEARKQMLLAAFEAGVCINNSSVTLVHGMSRPIGALFHVPHGMSNAMLLDECLRFAKEGAPERFGTLARVIGVADSDTTDEEASNRFIDEISKIVKGCQIPTPGEYGIDKEEFFDSIDKMSRDALDSGSPANTRKEVAIEDCRLIYRRLWDE